MKLTIDIDLDNAAFEENLTMESSQAIKNGLRRLPNFGREEASVVLFDTNGNRVGRIEVTA